MSNTSKRNALLLPNVERLSREQGLFIMGVVNQDDKGIVLLGATERMWQLFKHAPEYRDTKSHPLDRWSKRVIGNIAGECQTDCIFPSDGPPYPPFTNWAIASGRFWQSPIGMLIHDTVGLMISLRGALIIDRQIVHHQVADENPCLSCATKPCLTACPVNALSDNDYNVAACKTLLTTPEGDDCLSNGCLARRLCPISQRFKQDPQQSAFHMKAFLAGT